MISNAYTNVKKSFGIKKKFMIPNAYTNVNKSFGIKKKKINEQIIILNFSLK